MTPIKIQGFDLHPETKAFLRCDGTTPSVVLVRGNQSVQVSASPYENDEECPKLSTLFPNLANDGLTSVAANLMSGARASIVEDEKKPSSRWTVSIALMWWKPQRTMLFFHGPKADVEPFLRDELTDAAIAGFLPEYPTVPLQIRFWLCHFNLAIQLADAEHLAHSFACIGAQNPWTVDQYHHDWLQVPANSVLYNRIVRDLLTRGNRITEMYRAVRMDLLRAAQGKAAQKDLVCTPEYAREILESGYLTRPDNAWCQIAN